ncbi:family 16 glycosylhydrolase [Carboxylicivirga mesophila]|uniref:Family 16 glycosylhydrolase n=1 Tax=Carboxylicivirga mesophila TaxID=1166478 RepID=A0ABS5KFT4_9BACT|nr:family 16 glycosylhydrolase [Carboxylicivirga mesophila]MBS2213928.1 family 16 glycosylhydrolase [Carboxylicivirga mesophila]
MRTVLFLGIVLTISFLGSGRLNAQLIDAATAEGVQPNLLTPTGDTWTLDFSDEFEGTNVDPFKWNVIVSSKTRAPRPDLGIADWWWTAENVWQENGDLVLRVTKEDYNTMHCGSVNSNNLYETQYGYFEARMKIADASKGTHTAFWFQGDNQSNVDGTANDGAEIDVFESAWMEDYTKSVIHIDGYGADHRANTKKYSTPNIHDGNYHTWGFHWTESFMDIYYDGVFKVRYSEPDWIVKSPEFLWLSDGASFGYAGDNFTREPVGTLTHAYVDYVRVWKHVSDDEMTEYECESLTSSSPTGNEIQIKSSPVASAGQHVKFISNSTDSEIVFEVPIGLAGDHTFTLQSLTWSGFGQYNCAVETSPENWQKMSNSIDLYNNQSTLVSQSFEEIHLDAGTYRVKFTCVGKNASSTGFVGSFDKLIVNSRNTVSTSVEEHESAKEIKVYPNPVHDVLYISGLEAPTPVSIYNIQGVRMMQTITFDKIGVSQLKGGFYLAKIGNEIVRFRKR